MTDEPGEKSKDWEPFPPPASELDPRPEPFLFRMLRTAIAPPVLKDGGHDAPLSARGRVVFYAIVGVLVVGIVVLLLVTAASR